MQRVHAFGDDALGTHDAVELAALIKSGALNPRELALAAVQRAEKIDPLLNAIAFPVVSQLRSHAETVSERSDGAGLLAGVPTFLKDNVDIVGMPTRHGSEAVPPTKPRRNSHFVDQFLSSGMTVLGKTRLPEFGFNATGEFVNAPPVRNPWNTEHSSGASSSGAAVLVAAGVVPIAHGNDGGGSLRIPAACCGLVGLKPTRGRLISNELAQMLPINLVSEGVLTRSVRDSAAFFAAAERHRPARRLPPVGLVEGPGDRKLRIGLVLESPAASADEQTRAAVTDVAARLEAMGHVVEAFTPPVEENFVTDFVRYWGMMAFLLSTFGRVSVNRHFDRSKLDPLTIGLRKRYGREFVKTPMTLIRLWQARGIYAQAFEEMDLVLSPTLAHVTPPLGHLSPAVPFDELLQRLISYVSFTPLNNIAGGPAISVPTGMSSDGLPIGVQFSAAHGDERTLLEVAFALETERSFPRIAATVR